MDHDAIICQGPFDLKQGGKGIVIRNPVYLKQNDQKIFGDLLLLLFVFLIFFLIL